MSCSTRLLRILRVSISMSICAQSQIDLMPLRHRRCACRRETFGAQKRSPTSRRTYPRACRATVRLPPVLSQPSPPIYSCSRQCQHRDDQPYIPPTKPYELSELARDLVLLARYMLRPRGRLVFFLPTVTDEYEELDVHAMLCEGMELVANSLQNFGSWGRRVRISY